MAAADGAAGTDSHQRVILEKGAKAPFFFFGAIDSAPVSETGNGVRVEKWRRGDGALTERRMMRAMESDGFEVLVYTYRAGTAFPEHEHAQEKCDGVLEGVLRVTAGGEVFDLTAGDRIYLPPGTRHAAEVVGEKTVLSLDGTRW